MAGHVWCKKENEFKNSAPILGDTDANGFDCPVDINDMSHIHVAFWGNPEGMKGDVNDGYSESVDALWGAIVQDDGIPTWDKKIQKELVSAAGKSQLKFINKYPQQYEIEYVIAVWNPCINANLKQGAMPQNDVFVFKMTVTAPTGNIYTNIAQELLERFSTGIYEYVNEGGHTLFYLDCHQSGELGKTLGKSGDQCSSLVEVDPLQGSDFDFTAPMSFATLLPVAAFMLVRKIFSMR